MLGLLIIGAAAMAAPLFLRRVAFFHVRQREVIGVQYLVPDSLVAGLALRPDQNVFDDTRAIEQRAQALAGVVRARVQRVLPGGLRITVLEREPVAFTPGPGGLVVLDGDARPLPYNPAATGLDLPVIARVDTLLVRALSAVRLADATLFHQIDGATRLDRDGIAVQLDGARLLWPGIPSAEDVRAAGAVRRHLASKGRRYAELDARYEGWIVVRRSTT
jgi:cell division septal protein FtsQ